MPVVVQVPVPALVQAQVEAAALAQALQLPRLLPPASAAPFLEAEQAPPLGKAPEVAQLSRLQGTVQARVPVEAQALGTVPVPVLVLAQGTVPVLVQEQARAQVLVPVPGNRHPRCFPSTPQRPQ